MLPRRGIGPVGVRWSALGTDTRIFSRPLNLTTFQNQLITGLSIPFCANKWLLFEHTIEFVVYSLELLDQPSIYLQNCLDRITQELVRINEVRKLEI